MAYYDPSSFNVDIDQRFMSMTLHLYGLYQLLQLTNYSRVIENSH